jgi:hypothetical protein
MTTDSTSADDATQPLGVGSSEGLGAGAEARCRYPDCCCPLDDPGTPGWCARGLRRPFLFAGHENGAWFVWRQERAYATMAQRVAGPFAVREEAEALLGPAAPPALPGA